MLGCYRDYLFDSLFRVLIDFPTVSLESSGLLYPMVILAPASSTYSWVLWPEDTDGPLLLPPVACGSLECSQRRFLEFLIQQPHMDFLPVGFSSLGYPISYSSLVIFLPTEGGGAVMIDDTLVFLKTGSFFRVFLLRFSLGNLLVSDPYLVGTRSDSD